MLEILQPERCRVCGCTMLNACQIAVAGQMLSCAWYDTGHTLCTNPLCVAKIPLAELERMPLVSLKIL